MKKRNLICIVCPRGCALEVTFDADGKISNISGNACKRGVAYAENECTHPVRTVTSTVRCEDGSIVSVKTTAPVPKEAMLDVMREINRTRASSDVKIGDVIIKNILGLESDIVATSNKIV